MTFLFKVEAGKDIGIGHIKRIESIHYELLKLSKSSYISCNNHLDINEKYKQNLLPTQLYEDFENEIEKNSFVNHVIIDLSNKRHNENPNKIKRYISFLNNRNIMYSIIDGLGNDRLSKNLNFYNCENYFLPYIGSETVSLNKFNFKNKFTGSKYAPINSKCSYKYSQNKKLPRNILITCGGSDPYNNTFNILELITNIDLIDSEIRVVIGPYFSNELKISINKFLKLKNIKLISNPNSILELYKWSDIVITNTGTTRYECLSMDIPFIFFSHGIEPEYEPLLAFNKILNFSYHGDFKFKNINLDKLKMFFVSEFFFKLLVKSSSNIIDKKGSKRIANILIK